MTVISTESQLALEQLATHRAELYQVLQRYNASDLRVFGSVARGEATSNSDIDFLITLENPSQNLLMRLGGINEEFRQILGISVDVVVPEFLKDKVSETALAEAIPL